MAIDFFTGIDDIQKYVKGFTADTHVNTLEPDLRPAKKKMINLIGQDTYDALLEYFNTADPEPAEPKKAQAIEYLQAALANQIAIMHFIFESSDRNNTDRNVYRYQEEKMLDLYLENTWGELNSLLTYLAANADTFTDYADTDTYTERNNLFIKNAHEFHKYYGINNSEYFFTNCVFIIKEVQEDTIKPMLNTFPPTGEDIETLEWNIGKAIAFETVSRACTRFDLTELPKGLRHDMYRETNKKNDNDQEVKNKMATILHNKAQEYLRYIENYANKARNDGDLIIPEDSYQDDDKFYLM